MRWIASREEDIRCRQNQQSSWPQHAADLAQQAGVVRHVLNGLEHQRHVEGAVRPFEPGARCDPREDVAEVGVRASAVLERCVAHVGGR